MRKRILIVSVMLMFIASFVTLGMASDEITGQVTKVEGKVISVKQADGSIVKAEIGDGMDLKEGDTVVVKDGKVIKKDGAEKKSKRKVIEGC